MNSLTRLSRVGLVLAGIATYAGATAVGAWALDDSSDRRIVSFQCSFQSQVRPTMASLETPVSMQAPVEVVKSDGERPKLSALLAAKSRPSTPDCVVVDGSSTGAVVAER